MWKEPTLSTDRAVQFATAKTYVFSHPVLGLGGISDEPVKTWESKINKWFVETRYIKALDRIDGRAMEFEWKNVSGFTTLGILDEIQKMMTESKCDPEQFKGRIIFMSMYNDIDGVKRGNEEHCVANALRVTEYARLFPHGRWSFLGPGSEKWYGTLQLCLGHHQCWCILHPFHIELPAFITLHRNLLFLLASLFPSSHHVIIHEPVFHQRAVPTVAHTLKKGCSATSPPEPPSHKS